jgi:hypothetical protein
MISYLLMAISITSTILYVVGEIFLVKHNVVTFYMFIFSDILIVIQLFLNNTIVANFNVAFLQIFSITMSFLAIYNWKRIKKA